MIYKNKGPPKRPLLCDKLEFGVCFINFFRSTQVRSWNPYFFQVHLWLLRNMIF